MKPNHAGAAIAARIPIIKTTNVNSMKLYPAAFSSSNFAERFIWFFFKIVDFTDADVFMFIFTPTFYSLISFSVFTILVIYNLMSNRVIFLDIENLPCRSPKVSLRGQ